MVIKMNKKGLILSGLVYTLLVFFLLLVAGLIFVAWHRLNAISQIKDNANEIYQVVFTFNGSG